MNATLALIAIIVGSIVIPLDYSMVPVALPSMHKSTGATVTELQWVLNAFVLVLCCCVVFMGRLADRCNHLLLFFIGLVLFGGAALCLGISQSPDILIALRCIQALGAAIILPVAVSLLKQNSNDSNQRQNMSIWTACMAISLAIGPVVSGFLVASASWPWVFWLNAVLCLISLALSIVCVREQRERTRKQAIDGFGFATLALGLTAIVVGVAEAPDWGWVNPITLMLVLIGIIILAYAYKSQRDTKSPTIPVQYLKQAPFLIAAMSAFSTAFSSISLLFLMPQYLQLVQTQSAFTTGLICLAITVFIAVITPSIKTSLSTTHPIKAIRIGTVLTAVGTLMLLLLADKTALWYVAISLACFGIGWSFIFASVSKAGLMQAPKQDTRLIRGGLTTFRYMGSALGLALAGSLYRHFALLGSSLMIGIKAALWLLFIVSLFSALFVWYKQPALSSRQKA